MLRNTTGGDFVNINWFSFGDGTPPIDTTAWSAQLAQFNSSTPRPEPANTVRVAEFNATCADSHSHPDDPIIFPGRPGASHMRTFLGNDSTDAHTTTGTLLTNAGTTCRPAPDLSAYWIPTLYENDRALDVLRLPADRPVPIPQGFRMIAGDAKSQVPTPAGSAAGYRLGSGMASSMHGDAFFAWDSRAQGERVKNCNTDGNF